MFKQCQRQWYYDHVLADWRESNPLRREGYLLSKLCTIAAWRGQIVEKVLSNNIVQALNRKQPVNLKHILGDAKRLFDLQLIFARAHRLREPGFSASKAGEIFAAFTPIEYGEEIREDEIKEAWEQVPLEGSDCHKRIRRPRINWTARDESLSKAVTAHAFRLKDELGREAPLTKTAIARAVGNPSILKNLAKLPQTATAIREVMKEIRVGKSGLPQVSEDGI